MNINEISFTGETNKKSGAVNQDRIKTVRQENYLCVALADGAGSCKYAEEAAEIAVNVICDFMIKYFDRLVDCSDAGLIKRMILDRIITEHNEKAREIGADISEFGTTIMALCVKDNKAIYFGIGDGVVLYKEQDDEKFKVFAYPYAGFPKNQTILTTTYNADKTAIWKVRDFTDIKNMLFMTDGAAEIVYNHGMGCLNENFEDKLFDLPFTKYSLIDYSFNDDASFVLLLNKENERGSVPKI